MALDGLPSRLDQNQVSYRDAMASLLSEHVAADLVVTDCSVSDRSIGFWCQSDKREPPTLALIGDSHAIVLYQALMIASVPGQRWELIARPGCTFGIDIARRDGDVCNQLNAAVINDLVRDSGSKASSTHFGTAIGRKSITPASNRDCRMLRPKPFWSKGYPTLSIASKRLERPSFCWSTTR